MTVEQYADSLLKEICNILDTTPNKLAMMAAIRILRPLVEGAQAAYWHIDTYGVVQGDERQIASQDKVFKMLRNFCPPIPGRL